MMTLRYIFHSGFLLETAQCILVFDYWNNPSQTIRSKKHIHNLCHSK